MKRFVLFLLIYLAIWLDSTIDFALRVVFHNGFLKVLGPNLLESGDHKLLF